MVAGHLQEKNGMFYVVLNYRDENGKRKTPWISTNLPVKGNKKRAETFMMDVRRNFVPPNVQRIEEREAMQKGDILFTDFCFILVASYIEIPFMILPIFNALDDLDENIVNASKDLGANDWQTFTKVIFPLSLNGVRSGVQSVFIPSLSLFMLTRLIGGIRVITLGTAIEQHFLTTQNWGMGATIGVVLIAAMIATMWLTKERRQ